MATARLDMRIPLAPAFLMVFGFSHGSILAQGVLPGDRWPVRGTPLICGRAISQFVLLKDVDAGQRRISGFAPLKLLASLPKNLFTPVSEDKEGVFYHATNGVVERNWNLSTSLVPGGIHVSKAKPNVVFGYFGDARKPGWVLHRTSYPLNIDVLEKLRIGHFAGGRLKPAPKKSVLK